MNIISLINKFTFIFYIRKYKDASGLQRRTEARTIILRMCIFMSEFAADSGMIRLSVFCTLEESRKEMEKLVRFDRLLKKKSEKQEQEDGREDRIRFLQEYEKTEKMAELLCGIAQLSEAAANYRLAPMNIKRYYIGLSEQLRKKYSAELSAHRPERKDAAKITDISLYQDAEQYLLCLRDALTDIAFSRIETENAKGA